MPVNPWATSRTGHVTETPVTPAQQTNAYAVPSAGDAYLTQFGWAPKLAARTSATDVPSAQRLQTMPTYERQSDPQAPSDRGGLWDVLQRDQWKRRSASAVDETSTGWTVPADIAGGDRRWADNPRRTPPAEPRVTSRLGQNTYSFVRYFDQLNRTHDGEPPTGTSRQFNGMHFSMADHRRNYQILGMQPPRSRRNTYRLDPTPWDTGIVDMPPEDTYSVPAATITSYEIPAPSRTYRLS